MNLEIIWLYIKAIIITNLEIIGLCIKAIIITIFISSDIWSPTHPWFNKRY